MDIYYNDISPNFNISDNFIKKLIEFDREIYLFESYDFSKMSSIMNNHNIYYKQIITNKQEDIIGLIIVQKLKNRIETNKETKEKEKETKQQYYLYTLQIAEKYRRRNLAYTLLNNFLTKFTNIKIYLDVDKDNIGAIKLYEKIGFIKVGVKDEEQYEYMLLV